MPLGEDRPESFPRCEGCRLDLLYNALGLFVPAEFKNDAVVERDVIAAVVEAWGKGEITLEPVDKKAPKQSVYVAPGGATYTLQTVARFLKWTRPHGKDRPQPTRACSIAFDSYHAGAVVQAAVDRLPPNRRDATTVELITRTAEIAG